MENSIFDISKSTDSRVVVSGDRIQESLVETTERFVVFLDIMGFKDTVARESHDRLRDQLTGFNERVMEIINQEPDVEITQFSDSIFLFTRDGGKEDLKLITEKTQEIFFEAINSKLPMKGAMAYGKTTCNLAKHLFFGQPIVDAYLLEEDVKYYGIVVHHTAEQQASALLGDDVHHYFYEHPLPFRDGLINHKECAWYKKNPQQAITNVENIRMQVSDSPRRYIDNTVRVIQEYTAM